MTDRHSGAVRATLSGISDLFRKKPRIGTLDEMASLNGRTCLLTGAGRGLGKAIAHGLAKRGASLLLPLRSLREETESDIRKHWPSCQVQSFDIDLADLQSVEKLCHDLKKSDIRLDRVILNAGTVSRRARQTKQGFEMMFGVNYLSSFLLVNRLLEYGLIGSEPDKLPRIIFVSSEAHRSGGSFNFKEFGHFREFGISESMKKYGYSKLCINTFATELSRRLNRHSLTIPVHALCPGPVNSSIAREAPLIFQPLLKLIMGLFFRSPRSACEPVIYLTAAQKAGRRSGIYLHLMAEKSMAEACLSEENSKRLWEESARLTGIEKQ